MPGPRTHVPRTPVPGRRPAMRAECRAALRTVGTRQWRPPPGGSARRPPQRDSADRAAGCRPCRRTAGHRLSVVPSCAGRCLAAGAAQGARIADGPTPSAVPRRKSRPVRPATATHQGRRLQGSREARRRAHGMRQASLPSAPRVPGYDRADARIAQLSQEFCYCLDWRCALCRGVEQVRHAGAIAELLREARLPDLPTPPNDKRGPGAVRRDPGESLAEKSQFRLPADEARLM